MTKNCSHFEVFLRVTVIVSLHIASKSCFQTLYEINAKSFNILNHVLTSLSHTALFLCSN